MAGAITDLLDRVTDSTTGRPVVGALAAPGKAIAAPSINLADATNWTTTTGIHFSLYKTTTIGSAVVKDPTTQTDWKGTLAGVAISNLTITGGVDRTYVAGDIVELTPTARWGKDLYDWAIAFSNQDGTLKAAAVQAALGLGASTLNGWNALANNPNTITYNGNRSYSIVFNAVDLTSTLSAGMRIRTTRNTAAPNQCTSLNGTNQYWSKAAPTGMAQTDSITEMAWVKLTTYANAGVMSRSNGTTDGWNFFINSSGQVTLNGARAADDQVASYQSVPLNKWVHIAASINSAGATGAVYIDGVLVPSIYTNNANVGFLAPTQSFLVGAIQANSPTFFFPGKIAQAACFSAVIAQATIQGYISQGLIGTEPSLISAFAFNGNANDLNTTNANNLTSNGAAVATSADAPFGYQASGLISTTQDYAIIQSVVFSTNTTVVVQVPEGCTIPTSGTVSAVAYSSNKSPYGFPAQREKWVVEWIIKTGAAVGSVSGTWYSGSVAGAFALLIPIGEWITTYNYNYYSDNGAAAVMEHFGSLSTSNNSESNNLWTTFGKTGTNGASTYLATLHTKTLNISNAVATTYYPLVKATSSAGALGNPQIAFNTSDVVRAENAYL